MSKITWNEENTAKLQEVAGSTEGFITQESLVHIAETLGTSARSVGSKLRKIGYSVQKASEVNNTSWSENAKQALIDFLDANDGEYTYAELAAAFGDGAYTPKEIQGKVLSLELTGKVKPTEKVAAPRKYTPEEEDTFVSMATSGKFLEDIADALGKSIQSVRGKALSMTKSHGIKMPAQRDKVSKDRKDVLEGLEVATMSVADLVESTGRTERGIKSMLSRRGISCSDYDGESKRAKLDEAKDAE